MQRIVFRYHRDVSTGALGFNDLRAMFLHAAQLAELPITVGRRAILMGPPLPSGASSEAEFAVLELDPPRDPSEIGRLLNTHLAPGIHIACAWIAPPATPHENPASFDEAVYDVLWQHAPTCEELLGHLRRFLAATVVQFTRVREKKTQQLNARALVQHIALLGYRGGQARLRMVLSVGPQGSIRPDEVLQVLGCAIAPDTLRIHRVALLRSAWRHPSVRHGAHSRRQY